MKDIIKNVLRPLVGVVILVVLGYLVVAFFVKPEQDKNIAAVFEQNPYIIDVRTAEEFSSGHVEGAVNISVDIVGNHLESIKEIAKTRPIVVYCKSGGRAGNAKNIIMSSGVNNVYNTNTKADTEELIKKSKELKK